MSVHQRFDCRFDMFRQLRPDLDKLSQFRVFLQQIVQAGVKDRIFAFRKSLISLAM
jgi:hypothetical protein